MRPVQYASYAMIEKAAYLLAPILQEVVFLGGTATALLITDPAAPDIRPTEDVDVIVEVATRSKYYQLEERLRNGGFTQPLGEQNVICRWVKDGLLIDIMPTNEDILTFGNHWYVPAMNSAVTVKLTNDLSIRLISAPCFLATKIEAFHGGKRGTFLTSHDMEDIVSVVDGRPELVGEIQNAPPEVRNFLAETFQKFLQNEDFLEAVEGHLYPDSTSLSRMHIVLARMKRIAESGAE